jgi:hypothetical protein
MSFCDIPLKSHCNVWDEVPQTGVLCWGENLDGGQALGCEGLHSGRAGHRATPRSPSPYLRATVSVYIFGRRVGYGHFKQILRPTAKNVSPEKILFFCVHR